MTDSAYRGGDDGRFGFPPQLFDHLWTIKDVQAFLAVSENKARAWLADPDAPPAIPLGSQRALRWNPTEVVAWVHGEDWRQAPAEWPTTPVLRAVTEDSAGASQPAGTADRAPRSRPGRPWMGATDTPGSLLSSRHSQDQP